MVVLLIPRIASISSFVKISEVEGYLKAGAKAVGIGRELYAKEDYKEIIETAKNVVEMVRQI